MLFCVRSVLSLHIAAKVFYIGNFNSVCKHDTLEIRFNGDVIFSARLLMISCIHKADLFFFFFLLSLTIYIKPVLVHILCYSFEHNFLNIVILFFFFFLLSALCFFFFLGEEKNIDLLSVQEKIIIK